MGKLYHIFNFLWLAAVVWCRCTRSLEDDNSDSSCAEPRDIDLLSADRYADLVQSQTNSLYPGWNDDNSINNIPAQYKNVTYIHFQGPHGCENTPRHQTPHRHRHHPVHRNRINHIAYCPYKYVKNWDQNRKPNTLLETKCSCAQPTNADGFCQEVYMYVSVLRRAGCYLGRWQYDRVWEKISVACVSVRTPEPHESPRTAFPLMSDK